MLLKCKCCWSCTKCRIVTEFKKIKRGKRSKFKLLKSKAVLAELTPILCGQTIDPEELNERLKSIAEKYGLCELSDSSHAARHLKLEKHSNNCKTLQKFGIKISHPEIETWTKARTMTHEKVKASAKIEAKKARILAEIEKDCAETDDEEINTVIGFGQINSEPKTLVPQESVSTFPLAHLKTTFKNFCRFRFDRNLNPTPEGNSLATWIVAGMLAGYLMSRFVLQQKFNESEVCPIPTAAVTTETNTTTVEQSSISPNIMSEVHHFSENVAC